MPLPKGCMPALSVTYSAAAVATCGAIYVLCLYLFYLYVFSEVCMSVCRECRRSGTVCRRWWRTTRWWKSSCHVCWFCRPQRPATTCDCSASGTRWLVLVTVFASENVSVPYTWSEPRFLTACARLPLFWKCRGILPRLGKGREICVVRDTWSWHIGSMRRTTYNLFSVWTAFILHTPSDFSHFELTAVVCWSATKQNFIRSRICFNVLYRLPATGIRSPGIPCRQSAINDSLARKPSPNHSPNPNP